MSASHSTRDRTFGNALGELYEDIGLCESTRLCIGKPQRGQPELPTMRGEASLIILITAKSNRGLHADHRSIRNDGYLRKENQVYGQMQART